MSKRRSKKIILWSFLTLVILWMGTACRGGAGRFEEAPVLSSILYHNMASEESRQEVEDFLSGHIKKEALGQFMGDVRYYNGLMEGLDPALAGAYTQSETIPVVYPETEIFARLSDRAPEFLGNNCRISAFTLLGEYIYVETKPPVGDVLLFDKMSLSESDKFAPEVLSCFETFYDSIPTVPSKDARVHMENMRKYFDENKIRFDLPEGLSLLSVVYHESAEEDFLFTGHTGVMLEEKDAVYFLEKLSFEMPYQWIRFNNRQEVNDYLMRMYDTQWEQETAPVMIVENDRLMPEYRRVIKKSE